VALVLKLLAAAFAPEKFNHEITVMHGRIANGASSIPNRRAMPRGPHHRLISLLAHLRSPT